MIVRARDHYDAVLVRVPAELLQLGDDALGVRNVQPPVRIDEVVLRVYVPCKPDGLEAVRLLIDAGAEVNVRDDRGETALMKASQDWETGEVVGFLLEAGAAIDAADDQGRTALMHAIESGALESARVLLEAGADVNAHDHSGKTPLMYMGPYGDPLAIIDLLLKTGAEVNVRDHAGRTPLMHLKPQRDQVAIINLLLEAGADVHAKDNEGKTILMHARTKLSSDALTRLEEAMEESDQ